MMDILMRSVARAGGIEVPDDVRIFEAPPSRPSALKRLFGAFERWRACRSTFASLNQIDERTLNDIGLDRGNLHDVADNCGRGDEASSGSDREQAQRLAA
jgi:uncharacterized protein YjiS (DUF1127 family)